MAPLVSTRLGKLDPGGSLAWSAPEAEQQSCPGRRDRDPPPFPEGRAGLQIEFTAALLRDVRRAVDEEARRACLRKHRREDLVLAVDELATNSVMHGGGTGTLSVWRDERGIACEVRDRGHIEDPLVGLRPPATDRLGGRGLWVVSRVCDRVQIASSPGRTAVRVQMAIP